MTEETPRFRFYPNAFQDEGVFERSDALCGVCGKPCGFRYIGAIYGKTIENPCPDCIANGALSAAAGGAGLQDIDLDEAKPDLADEVLCRTPGVVCFNPFAWPVLDGVPLVFAGYGDNPDVIACAEAQAAIKREFSELGWDFEPGEPTPYALVFRELDGPRYRAVIDLD